MFGIDGLPLCSFLGWSSGTDVFMIKDLFQNLKTFENPHKMTELDYSKIRSSCNSLTCKRRKYLKLHSLKVNGFIGQFNFADNQSTLKIVILIED